MVKLMHAAISGSWRSLLASCAEHGRSSSRQAEQLGAVIAIVFGAQTGTMRRHSHLVRPRRMRRGSSAVLLLAWALPCFVLLTCNAEYATRALVWRGGHG
jgi:hypothetical protein